VPVDGALGDPEAVGDLGHAHGLVREGDRFQDEECRFSCANGIL
jgi:hypothetical protein